MSDKPVPPLPAGILSEDQIAKIGGGDCTVTDYITILNDLRSTYDNLVEFTSYVIERVAGP
jgi:hypothetical protein